MKAAAGSHFETGMYSFGIVNANVDFDTCVCRDKRRR
jgi:hypothetical protein